MLLLKFPVLCLGVIPGLFLGAALEISPSPLGIPQDYISQLTDRLRYAFHNAREAMERARIKQKTNYDKRAGVDRFQVGCKVLLDRRERKPGESTKFLTRYQGIYRIVRKYDDFTVDITDNSYKIQRVHVNRLKLVYESQLYRDEAFQKFDPTEDIIRHFHNNTATQTIENLPGIISRERTTEKQSENQEETRRIDLTLNSESSRLEITPDWLGMTFENVVFHPIPIEVSKDCRLQKLLPKRKSGRPKKERDKDEDSSCSLFI